MLPCVGTVNREGCYLYFDMIRGAFIRSGKVTRRGFSVRGDEHFKASKEAKATSDFYFLYPSTDSPRADKRDKRDVFENLSMLVGAGFDPNS